MRDERRQELPDVVGQLVPLSAGERRHLAVDQVMEAIVQAAHSGGVGPSAAIERERWMRSGERSGRDDAVASSGDSTTTTAARRVVDPGALRVSSLSFTRASDRARRKQPATYGFALSPTIWARSPCLGSDNCSM
jgi:hypothetical protein